MHCQSTTCEFKKSRYAVQACLGIPGPIQLSCFFLQEPPSHLRSETGDHCGGRNMDTICPALVPISRRAGAGEGLWLQKMEMCGDSGRWAESSIGEQHGPFYLLSKYYFPQVGELSCTVLLPPPMRPFSPLASWRVSVLQSSVKTLLPCYLPPCRQS